MRCDLLTDNPFAKLHTANTWIHAGPLALTLPWLAFAAQAGVKRLIAFSSTSIFTKIDSSSADERNLIANLQETEHTLAATCQRFNIHWTIFRPTMIYGNGMDQNISFIMKTVDRFGFFPIAGAGSGLRQPVHADDLAQAALHATTQKVAFNRSYNLSGGETLSYKAMVERIFLALDKQPTIIPIHPKLYKLAIFILKKTAPRYAFVQPSMVDRMAMNMVFDHTEASRDFDYAPRTFQP